MKKMLKIGLFLLFFSLGFVPLTLASAPGKEQTQVPGDYLPENTYTGFYRPQRVYIFNPNTRMWSPEKRAKTANYSCIRARLDLEQKGIWTGNLDDQSRCIGDAEAPQRATGNYLNYLQQKRDAGEHNQQN